MEPRQFLQGHPVRSLEASASGLPLGRSPGPPGNSSLEKYRKLASEYEELRSIGQERSASANSLLRRMESLKNDPAVRLALLQPNLGAVSSLRDSLSKLENYDPEPPGRKMPEVVSDAPILGDKFVGPIQRDIVGPEYQLEQQDVPTGTLDFRGDPVMKTVRRDEGLLMDDPRVVAQNRADRIKAQAQTLTEQDLAQVLSRGRQQRRSPSAVHGGSENLGARFGPTTSLGQGPAYDPVLPPHSSRRRMRVPLDRSKEAKKKRTTKLAEFHEKGKKRYRARAADVAKMDLKDYETLPEAVQEKGIRDVINAMKESSGKRRRAKKKASTSQFELGRSGEAYKSPEGGDEFVDKAAKRAWLKGRNKRRVEIRHLNVQRARLGMPPLTGDRAIDEANARKAAADAERKRDQKNLIPGAENMPAN